MPTDAQIALYAAVRVAIPTSWRVLVRWPRRIEPGVMVIVECWRDRGDQREQLRHAVDAVLLEDPRWSAATIALDTEQIVYDLMPFDVQPGPLGGLVVR